MPRESSVPDSSLLGVAVLQLVQADSGAAPAPTADIGQIYLVSAIALGVILFALGAALVIYQRRFVKLHRSYAKNLLNAQEEERAWVAREVHDDALQRVAMVVHELHDWESEGALAPTKQLQRVEGIRQEIEDLAVMLRRVAHRLHPSLIDQGGLVPALQGLANDVSRSSGMQVNFWMHTNGSHPIPRDTALILYRIAQEALRNASKHSGAKDAQLELTVTGETVTMSVSDKGKGFVTDDTARKRGLGLLSMTERARLADGRLEVSSEPGKGTTIRAMVPIPRDRSERRA
jgi:signal transduction histidine kinase